jgi:hypothetical protein
MHSMFLIQKTKLYDKIIKSMEGNRAQKALGKSMLAHALLHVMFVSKETIT